jgi:hypothetical protein
MVFHGLLEAADYSRHLARANIGVGSLALHRKRLNEASPLKVREYLATGLPVINGYTDTDYPDGADFLLTLPNTEDNVEAGLGAIRDFVAKWSTLRVPREAVGHLDYAAKEATRLDFFRTLLPRP